MVTPASRAISSSFGEVWIGYQVLAPLVFATVLSRGPESPAPEGPVRKG
ncbi:hypothetical protein [Kitasatospora griseola]|nr:hypothetical protein [Kitasatospora griseola]